MNNVYYSPHGFGLDTVCQVEWDGGDDYGFDLTVVWFHEESGVYFWDSDSGCSCPSPFEDVTGLESLHSGTGGAAINELADRLEHSTALLNRGVDDPQDRIEVPAASQVVEAIATILKRMRSQNITILEDEIG